MIWTSANPNTHDSGITCVNSMFYKSSQIEHVWGLFLNKIVVTAHTIYEVSKEPFSFDLPSGIRIKDSFC